MSVKWNAATRYSAHPFTTKTGARVHFFCLNYPRIRGWYQARVHPFSSGNGKGDHKTIYFSTYPGRQCWSLPPMRTMLMFGLVKHRHSQCWCLTPVKKSMDLGSAMKCKIIIHIFIIPISQRVRVLGTEFETYKILRLLIFRTGNKSISNICKYLYFYCQSSRTKHGTLNGLEICRSQKLMSQIDIWINAQRNRELSLATGGRNTPPKILSVK